MAQWQKSKPGDFKINFTSMAQATEWLIVRALGVRINASIMGTNIKVSATRTLEDMIPTTWEDEKYKIEKKQIHKNFDMKKMQCYQKEGKLSEEKLNEALDTYSDDMYKAIWNLFSRIGKLPQTSEVTDDD